MAARSPDLLVPLLASRSAVTLDQICQTLGGVSHRTAFRYLRQVRHLRSYNHNGRFYTDRDPALFDRFGLLSLGDVHFSRDTSLSATVLRLLAEAEAGFTDKELRSLLQVPVHPFLLAAVRHGRARRERLGRAFVYLLPGPAGARQRQARRAAARETGAGADLDPETVIEVLLALVRRPGSPPTAVARHLQGHSPPILRAQAQAVFDRFDVDRLLAKGGLYSLLTLLREQARSQGWSGRRIARSTLADGRPPRVDFVAEPSRCPRCGGALRSHKSQTRLLITLAAGCLLAREVRKHCPDCPPPAVAVSRRLAALAPPGQRFGYDLIVWVGLARYHHHLQRDEIRAALARQGCPLSAGSVSALCDRFLVALEALHFQRARSLRAAMPHGYPLHLDATCDKGKGGSFLCLGGWNEWVLNAVRIDSENERELRPALDRTLTAFGQPVAFVRDLGSAGAKAVAGVRRQGTPDLLCHYHFLAAVGRQLLDADYARLRRRIARSRVRGRLRALLRTARAAREARPDLAALLLWILEAEGRKHLPYPFALPLLEFEQRCQRFARQRDRRLPDPRTRLERRLLRRAREALQAFRRQDRRRQAAGRLERRWTVFCELRSKLRFADDDLPRGARRPPPDPRAHRTAADRLQSIAADLQAYHRSLRRRARARAAAGRPAREAEGIVLRYLDRYGDGLCGHPVARGPDGQPLAVVHRTNNVLEQFFARAKQGLRRRLGRAHSGRDLEDQPAQAALAANLRHPDYVRALCGTLDQLPRAFAELGGHPLAGPSPLDRRNRDAALQRRNRDWAAAADADRPAAN